MEESKSNKFKISDKKNELQQSGAKMSQKFQNISFHEKVVDFAKDQENHQSDPQPEDIRECEVEEINDEDANI